MSTDFSSMFMCFTYVYKLYINELLFSSDEEPPDLPSHNGKEKKKSKKSKEKDTKQRLKKLKKKLKKAKKARKKAKKKSKSSSSDSSSSEEEVWVEKGSKEYSCPHITYK